MQRRKFVTKRLEKRRCYWDIFQHFINVVVFAESMATLNYTIATLFFLSFLSHSPSALFLRSTKVRILAIVANFSDFLEFTCCKNTNYVSIYQIMSAVF